MLDQEEKLFLNEIFFDTNITTETLKMRERQAKNQEKKFWKTLYLFTHEHRIPSIDKDDRLIEIWLYNVAPS